MSADNMIRAFPFRKMTGEVVWRVMEVTLSGLPYEMCLRMSTKVRYREFLEYTGRTAAQQANGAARRFERHVGICEYGISQDDDDAEPYTMASLLQKAVEEGYDVTDLVEANDAFLARLPKSDWLPA
jgi:hypothetical protein